MNMERFLKNDHHKSDIVPRILKAVECYQILSGVNYIEGVHVSKRRS